MSEQKDRWTQLAETARELNKVLGLEPEIPTSDVSEAELEEKLEEAAALVAPEDEFTDQTAYVLSEFTDVVEVPEGYRESEVEEAETEESESEVEEDDGQTVVTEEAEAEEAEEDSEEEYTLEEIRELVETTSKRKDLRIFAGEFPDIFEGSIEEMNDGGLRSSNELKESMLADLDAEANETEEDFEDEAEESEVEESEEVKVEEEEDSEEEADKSEEQESESEEKTDEPDKSAMYYVRRFTCENPEITTDELMKKLKETGFDDPNRSSVSIRKNEMQHAVAIMDELGKLK